MIADDRYVMDSLSLLPNRMLKLLRDGRFVRRAEVHAPFELEQFFLFRVSLFFVQFFNHLGCIVIRDAREGGFDIFQLGQIAIQ